MKAFMLGWEFPPFISGGLGTACYGLTRAMDRLGMEVTFVLPHSGAGVSGEHLKLVGSGFKSGSFSHIRFRTAPAVLKPYVSSGTFSKTLFHQQSGSSQSQYQTKAGFSGGSGGGGHIYGWNMHEEVNKYARLATDIASTEEFDVIHAHDWMTFPAGIAVSKASGKPFIAHIHSTEFDRSGENVNQMIYDIEREGMHAARRVIAVSNYTKSIIVNRYGIPAEKVEVVYNGVDYENGNGWHQHIPAKTDKIVLFLGRITMQKGPEYFLAAAKKVLEKMSNVKFIMAGDGDMMRHTIELAAHLGIGHKVLFTKFLRGHEVDKVYKMADLYVMPSVSEPFGIAPLEALARDVPVLISRTSGIAEVLQNALKVDFWDINQMANKIIAVLRHAPLRQVLTQNGKDESKRFRWENSAQQIRRIYEQTLTASALG